MSAQPIETKFLLVLGGISGFILAFIGGLFIGNDITIVLRNASIGCVIGALLMKGFSQVLISQFSQAARLKQQSSLAAQEKTHSEEQSADTSNTTS